MIFLISFTQVSKGPFSLSFLGCCHLYFPSWFLSRCCHRIQQTFLMFLSLPSVSDSAFIITIHRTMSCCAPPPKSSLGRQFPVVPAFWVTCPREGSVFAGSRIHISPRCDIFTFVFLFSPHCCYRVGLTSEVIQTSQHSQNKRHQLFFFLT